MVTYRQIAPPSELAQYVRFFWYFEMSGISGGDPYVYRSMADGCVEILFHYKARFINTGNGRNEAEPLSIIQGASRHYQRYETGEDFGIFGVYLYPYAIQCLFGMPASELSNRSVCLQDVFGIEGRVLEERIMMAADNTARCRLLTDLLLSKLVKANAGLIPAGYAVAEMIHATEVPDVKKLAEKYYLSVRQFERQFKIMSGFSPKLYNRISRFNRAMALYGDTPRRLTDIAYACGYYDQAHFIHDFKEFSGYHPGAYFSGKTEGIECREV